MRKIFSFMLLAAGLLISAQSYAENTVSLTIGDQVTEFATLEQAVAAAEVAGEGVIKLLPAYNRYPNAWLTDCTIDGPEGYDTNDKGLFTFHAFNPSGDNALFDKVKAGDVLTLEEETRAKQIVKEINPALSDEMIDLNVDIKLLGGYANWGSDFEVYFDADITAGDYLIAGNYGEWGWLSSFGDQDFTIDATANERFPLLGTAMPYNTLHYWELMTSVNHFHCGIISLNPDANGGKTFWCELYLYHPENKAIKILLNQTPYTFPKHWTVIRGENSHVVAENDHALANGEIGTFVVRQAVKEVRGGKVYEINERIGAVESVTAMDLVEAEFPLVANRPYIFKASADKLEGVLSGDEQVEEAGDYNGLIGKYEYFDIPSCEQGNLNFMVYQNKMCLCGDGCYINAGLAYVDMNDVPEQGQGNAAPGRAHFTMAGRGATTGTLQHNMIVPANGADRVMIDGHFYIVKDGELINILGF